MKKLLATIVTLVFLVGLTTNSFAAVAGSAKKTLSGFGTSATLSSSQKSQLKQLAASLPNAKVVSCFGFRSRNTKSAELQKIEARTLASCDFIKSQLPSVITDVSVISTGTSALIGKIDVTLQVTFASAEAISLSQYDPESVSIVAKSKIIEYLVSVENQPKISYTFKSGSKTTADQVSKERKRIEKSTLFWSAMYSGTPTVFIYTGRDADWMVQQLVDLGNKFHSQMIKDGYWQKTGECMQSLAVVGPAGDYYINCQRTGYRDNRMSIIAAHEFAHIPLTTKFNNQPGGRMTKSPTWLHEGGAQFFGLNLTDQSLVAGFDYWHKLQLGAKGPVTLAGNSQAEKLRQIFQDISPEETVDLMTQMESSNSLQSDVAYSTGLWATELLIASGGVEKYFAFLNAINPSTDWKTAFANTYGISITDFYKSMTDYLRWLPTKY